MWISYSRTGVSTLNTVEYGTINTSTGSVTWQTETDTFSTARGSPSAVAYNGYLYVLGGLTTSPTTYHNDIQYAQIQSDGSIGAFTTDYYDIGDTGTSGASVYAYAENGFLQVVFNLLTRAAPIGNNGAMKGVFETSDNNVICGWSGLGVAHYKGYAYYTGGLCIFTAMDYVGSNYTNTVPAIAQYSKSFDFDTDVTPVSCMIYGTDAGNKGVAGEQVFTSVGGIFGMYRGIGAAATEGSNLSYLTQTTSSNLSTPKDCSTNHPTNNSEVSRLFTLSVLLDETKTKTFPDGDGTMSTITDLEIRYHPNSGKRLRGGKTFTNEG